MSTEAATQGSSVTSPGSKSTTSTGSPATPEAKESPLSPNAPVFFPKWKFASSPGVSRRGFNEGAKGQHDREGGNDQETPHGFANAGFQIRSPPAQQMMSPNTPRRAGRGGGSPAGQQQQGLAGAAHNPPMSPLASRAALGPGARSSSWREDMTFSGNQQQPQQPSSATNSPVMQHRELSGGAGSEEGKVGSSKAITVEHRMIKPGCYSTWIRVLSADVGPAQMAAVLARCEESNNKGTIHVYLREKFLNRQLIQQLKSQGYKFHHFVDETQTFVYGKRHGTDDDSEKELLNATAKEMVGVFVLSPDEQNVLMVWEAGKWSCLMGHVMTRESVIEGLRREVRVQLNLEVDKTYPSRAVGGWAKAAAKYDCINEILTCFAVKATSTNLNLDEDTHAQWFSVDELIQLLEMVDGQFKQHGIEPLTKLDSAIEHPPGNVFSHTALRWLKAYRMGLAWSTTNIAERYVFCCM